LLSLFQQAGSETESEWIVENLIVGKPGLKLFDRVLEDSSPGLKDSLEESSASSSSTPLEGSLAAPGGRREEARPKFDYDDKGLIVAAKSQRLEKLHEILLDIQQKFSGSGANEDVDFRGIVFVKTRQSVREILERIRSDATLKTFFTPEPFLGQVCMTIQEQYEATQRFRKGVSNAAGGCNLLLATSVAEEGLDFPACNVVVRYSSATSHTALIQSRGRVRAKDGTMFVLTRSNPHSGECKAFKRSQRHEKYAKDAAALLAQR